MSWNLGEKLMNIEKQKPIGVFDSGLGGLTVVKQLKELLPNENIIYLGDTARVPYGTKSKKSIIKFSLENAEFLNSFNIKALVIACNTASSYAYHILKEKYDIPVLNVVETGAISAVSNTKSSRIGVIGTSATIKSRSYESVIKGMNSNIEVFSIDCPLFVPLVEEGWLDNEITEAVTRKYLNYFCDKDIDVLILGCTHYPLLKKVIRKVVGDNIVLVDSAEAIAYNLKDVLEKNDIKNNEAIGENRIFVSDYTENFLNISRKILNNNELELEITNIDEKELNYV
jgi:glutamate racemase